MAKTAAFLIICALALLPFVILAEVDVEEAKDESKVELNDDGFEIRDHVVVLNNDNFDDAVEKYTTLLVEFYAPWCGHCKQLAPEYSKAAKILSDHEHPVVLASVDATVHSDLAQRFDVSGYPTLKFFKEGKSHPYEGPRDQDGIVKYMKEIADPSWEPEPEAVLTLTKDTFKTYADNSELMLVEFYAPWCGHCKRLAPIYEKAAKLLQRQFPEVVLAKVDATQEQDIASEYGISGYPTLKIFKNGKSRDYTGERNSEYDIVSYMIQQAGDGTQPVHSLKEMKKLVKEDDVTVVGFFSSGEDPLAQVYRDVADEIRNDYTFLFTLDGESRKAYKVKAGSIVVFQAERFYTKFESKWNVLEVKESTTADDVKSFISKHSLPLVGHYSTDSAMTKRYETRRPLCLVFYSVDFGFEHRKATQLWRNKIAAIAKEYPEITFAVADDEQQSSLVKEFGLDDSGEELNIGLYGADKRRYRMEPMEEYDSDEIKEFLDKYKKGKLTPFIKSQIAPKKQGPVITVTGNTFDKIVLDKSKDVLIEMYAPWCGHCKNLEPIYLSLAKKLKSERNLVIAKMDATANDAPESFSASGFPTIYFAPATSEGKSKPLKYEGGRDVESFESYLKENAAVSFGKKARDEL